MNIDVEQSSTPQTTTQISPSARLRLIELGEAKLRLRRYRSEVIGSGKADAVSRLIDSIIWLEASETGGASVIREPQPTSSASAKRHLLLRELRTGRKIPAYEMVSIAGLQYNRAVHELRWNIGGCVTPDFPRGLGYGLNIQNDNPNPKRPDHTVFWMAPGHWTKPVRVGSKTTRRVVREVRAAIDRCDAVEARRPAATLFGDLSPDRSYVE
jgi:hypothetical protein